MSRRIFAAALCAALFVTPALAQEGRASWYQCCNSKTACGVRFHPDMAGIAHRTLKCGTLVRVTDKRTGRSIVAPVVDRGPFIAGRIVDLTRGSARALGIIGRGTAPVRITIIK